MESADNNIYAIIAPTGKIGRVCAKTLLAAGRKVRAVLRDGSVPVAVDLAKKGAEIAEVPKGYMDTEGLIAAFKGASIAFILLPPVHWITPPSQITDVYGDIDNMMNNFYQAVVQNNIKKVVLNSTIGADQPVGTGLLIWGYKLEQLFFKANIDVTCIRGGYYAENFAADIPKVIETGLLHSTYRSDLSVPMVATKDIGAEAAKQLMDHSHGVKIIEMEGPVRLTMIEATAIIAQVLNKPVQFVSLPEDTTVQALKAIGANDDFAQGVAGISRGVNSGAARFSGNHISVRGVTPLEDVIRSLVSHN